MGVERNNNVVEPEENPDSEQPETDRSPPPDRPGQLGSSEQREPDTKDRDEQAPPENGKTDTTPPDRTEQRHTDRETDSPPASFGQRPSYGGFANLAEEFDARAKSRIKVNELNSGPEERKPGNKSQSVDFEVDDESLRECIDPVGGSERSDGTAGDHNQTGDRIGSALDEESAEKSRAERIRGAGNKNSEDLVDKAQQTVDKLDRIFGPHPTGQAETRTNSDPRAVDTHHSGVDPGSTVSALLAAGIVGAELFHRVKTKIRGEQ